PLRLRLEREDASCGLARADPELGRGVHVQVFGRGGDSLLQLHVRGDIREHQLEVGGGIPVDVRHPPTLVGTTLAAWPSRPSIRSSPLALSRASSPTRCRRASGPAPSWRSGSETRGGAASSRRSASLRRKGSTPRPSSASWRSCRRHSYSSRSGWPRTTGRRRAG